METHRRRSTVRQLTVRYFAAARAAAGAETETVRVAPGTTVAALVDTLAARGPELARGAATVLVPM